LFFFPSFFDQSYEGQRTTCGKNYTDEIDTHNQGSHTIMKEVYGKHLACTVVLAIIWLIIVTKRDEDINLNSIAVKINSAITSLEKEQQQQRQKPFESCDVLDFSEPIKCGGCKCFVPSPKQSAEEGYLVLHDNCIDTGLANMEVSYELATELKYKFEIKHTLLEPPL
jgi:hypothetical protein